MKNSKSIKKKPLGESIANNILEYISINNMEIGDCIPSETELGLIFSVGRGTIREAIKMLVSKGILEVRRGAGTFILRTTSPEDDPLDLQSVKNRSKLALDLTNFRIWIEPEIAALAAEYATEEERVVLKELCDKVTEKIRMGEDHLDADISFHNYLSKCSGNTVVKSVLPMVGSAVKASGELTNLKLSEETIKSHEAITNAVLRHDSPGARYAMMMHLCYNRIAIIEVAEELE